MSAWLPAIPGVLLSLAALILPGAAISRAAGLRGRLLVMATPLVSVMVISVLPILCAPIGISWGWLPLVLGTALIVAACLGIRRLMPSHATASGDPWFDFGRSRARHAADDGPLSRRALITLVILGPLLACMVGAFAFAVGVGTPTAPAQTFDAVFHLNAIRWIHETGNGSSLDLWAVATPERTPGFYPAAWHDLAALAYTGDTMVAANATTLVISCFLWPVGLAVLCSELFGNRPAIWILAPMVATLYVSMPEGLASWGTLYANLMANVLVPWFLAAFLRCLSRSTTDRWRAMAVMIAGAVAIALSHPNTAYAVLLFVPIPFVLHVVDLLRGKAQASRVWKALAFATPVVGVAGFLVIARTGRFQSMLDYPRHVQETGLKQSLIDVLTDSPRYFMNNGENTFDYLTGNPTVILWILPVFLVIGTIAALRTGGLRWLPIPAAVSGYLLLSVIAVRIPDLPLTGIWYNDATRLQAVYVLMSSPLVVLGLLWTLDAACALLRHRTSATPRGAAAISLGVICALVVAGSGIYNFRTSTRQLGAFYDWEQVQNPLVTGPELEMMRRLGEELPPDARVVGDPFSGAPLMYAVSGVDSILLSLNNSGVDQPLQDLALGLTRYKPRRDACDIREKWGVDYVYTDTVTFWPAKQAEYPLYVNLHDARGQASLYMTLVDQGSTAQLWSAVPCSAY